MKQVLLVLSAAVFLVGCSDDKKKAGQPEISDVAEKPAVVENNVKKDCVPNARLIEITEDSHTTEKVSEGKYIVSKKSILRFSRTETTYSTLDGKLVLNEKTEEDVSGQIEPETGPDVIFDLNTSVHTMFDGQEVGFTKNSVESAKAANDVYSLNKDKVMELAIAANKMGQEDLTAEEMPNVAIACSVESSEMNFSFAENMTQVRTTSKTVTLLQMGDGYRKSIEEKQKKLSIPQLEIE